MTLRNSAIATLSSLYAAIFTFGLHSYLVQNEYFTSSFNSMVRNLAVLGVIVAMVFFVLWLVRASNKIDTLPSGGVVTHSMTAGDAIAPSATSNAVAGSNVTVEENITE